MPIRNIQGESGMWCGMSEGVFVLCTIVSTKEQTLFSKKFLALTCVLLLFSSQFPSPFFLSLVAIASLPVVKDRSSFIIHPLVQDTGRIVMCSEPMDRLASFLFSFPDQTAAS